MECPGSLPRATIWNEEKKKDHMCLAGGRIAVVCYCVVVVVVVFFIGKVGLVWFGFHLFNAELISMYVITALPCLCARTHTYIYIYLFILI